MQDDDGILHLESKNYIGLDWHPRAKELFFKVNNSDLVDFITSLDFNASWSFVFMHILGQA